MLNALNTSTTPCSVTCCTFTDFEKRKSTFRSQPEPGVPSGHVKLPVLTLLRGTVLPTQGHCDGDSSQRPLYPSWNGSRLVAGLMTRGEPMKRIADAWTSNGSKATALAT